MKNDPNFNMLLKTSALIIAILAGFIWGMILMDAFHNTCRTYVYRGDIKAAQAACYEYGWKPERD